MERIETTALKNLIHNEEYTRKVLPFLKPEYFSDRHEQILFNEIEKFVSKYNNLPTKESLSIEINSNKTVNEDEYKKITDIISSLDPTKVDLNWLVETTEKFCKDRAIHNAILGGIQIIDGKDKQHTPEYLPEMLSNALAVSFDQKVGHDYLEESKERFDFYRTKEERLELDLDYFMSDLEELPYQMYETKINKLQSKTTGKLIIKEYPTASAHTGHFKSLINELALKKSFKPDIVFIDYLNICASSRFKAGSNVNSYTYIKSIAEELRGLAVENDIPIFSATQTTRGGYVSSDVGLEDTSESFGLPATADFMFALISNEELEEKNQILVKQLKNRYNDPTLNRKFIIGVDRSKMRLYDVEQIAQEDLVDSGQDKSSTITSKFEKQGKFSDFKV